MPALCQDNTAVSSLLSRKFSSTNISVFGTKVAICIDLLVFSHSNAHFTVEEMTNILGITFVSQTPNTDQAQF